MKIPVLVQSTRATIGEPIAFGVPLPRGAVRAARHWTLDGRTVGATVLDRWADGSARWVLVDARIDHAAGQRTTYLIAADALSAFEHGVHATEQDGHVVVDTGRIRLVARLGGRFPFDGLEANGREVCRTGASGLAITDSSGAVTHPTVALAAVEHATGERVVVRVEAHAVVGGKRLALTARLELFAGSAAVRLRCTIRNRERAVHPGNFWDLGDPGSALLKDCSFVLTSDAAGRPAHATVRVSDGDSEHRPTPLPLELYQDSSGGDNWQSSNHINRERRVPVTFRGYRLSAGASERLVGDRATPIVAVSSEDETLAVAVPEFWQNFPRSIEADAGMIRVGFFPSQYGDLHELQGGEQKTHECIFTVGSGVTPTDLDWCLAPSTVGPTPEWIYSTGVEPGLAPLEDGHRALVNQAVDGADTFVHKREVIDQYGWRHFGEIYGDHEAIGHVGPPLVSHYNNQYDPVAGFAMQYLRTGDVRWRRAMDELGRHVVDVDIYHTNEDKSAYNGGLFWHTYHYGDADTSTHRTYPRRNTGKVFGGGPSADHNYPTGLMLRYFITGDTAAREAALGLAEYVLNLDDGSISPFRFLTKADTGNAIFTPPDYYGPSRSSGNSLNALIDGHRLTGDRRFLAKAEQVIRRAAHPNEDPGRNRLDEPEYRWFYAMFLQSLGKYLMHRAELGLVDEAYAYARATLLSYARWMAEHEYPYLEKPEKLEFPTETWAAQDIRKADILTHAALHAIGQERIRFLERAAFFHEQSIRTLKGMPTRSLARPVVVLLTSGAWLEWLRGQADAGLPEGPGGVDFGDPVKFVGQRRIAERRAKAIAVAGAVAAIAGAALLAVWLW